MTVEDGGLDNDLATTGDNASFSRTVVVVVNPINDTPTLDAINDLTIDEDAAQQTINLEGITAGPFESQTLRVTATSDNTALIANPTVTYTSANATGSLAFTPVADQLGTATITVTVEDAGLDNDLTTTADNATFSRTFDVTVGSVNDDPTLDSINDISIDEDTVEQRVDLIGIGPGNNEFQRVRVTASSNDPSLIPDPSVLVQTFPDYLQKDEYNTGNGPIDIAIADLDGDNLMDMVVANRGSDSISILKGNALGEFSLLVNTYRS